MRNLELYFIQRCSLVFIGCRCVAFVTRTRRIGPKIFVPFRKIVKDSSGSVSWNTQPNCRTSFNIAIALLSPPFFGFLFGCSSSFLYGNVTYCRIYNPMRCQLSQKVRANTCQEVSPRLSIDLPRWTPTSEGPFSRRTSTSLCLWLTRWSGFEC